tara:strand:- start:926 stop:1174 length:249 start_codon:yes stop_codon:yes gene_type:complete
MEGKQKPIYRVIVNFEYQNKGQRTQKKYATIDSFAYSTEEVEIKEHLMGKMLRKIKKKENQVIIKIKDIEIKGQYGYTSQRF